MNSKVIEQIKTMGLENYIDNVFAKKAKGANLALFLFFLLGGVFLGVIGVAGDWGFGIVLGVISLVIAFLCLKKKAPKQGAYKEALAKRYGDTAVVLKEIEDLLANGQVHTLDRDGFAAVAGWLVVMCKMQGVHFIRKTDIAAVFGTNSGTGIVCDDGKEFTCYFNNGDYAWDEAFYLLAAENPFLLSNDDLIINAKGAQVPLEKLLGKKEAIDLIVKQYRNNKAE